MMYYPTLTQRMTKTSDTPETKHCCICSKEMTRPNKMAVRIWNKRTTCSNPCKQKYLKQNRKGFYAYALPST